MTKKIINYLLLYGRKHSGVFSIITRKSAYRERSTNVKYKSKSHAIIIFWVWQPFLPIYETCKWHGINALMWVSFNSPTQSFCFTYTKCYDI